MSCTHDTKIKNDMIVPLPRKDTKAYRIVMLRLQGYKNYEVAHMVHASPQVCSATWYNWNNRLKVRASRNEANKKTENRAKERAREKRYFAAHPERYEYKKYRYKCISNGITPPTFNEWWDSLPESKHNEYT